MALGGQAKHLFESHKTKLLMLIEKIPGNMSIDKLRPLSLLEELMKLQDTIQNGRYMNALYRFDLLDDMQKGFVKNKDTGSAIFVVSQMIEDCREQMRELWQRGSGSKARKRRKKDKYAKK